ncbi:MAG: alpha/beta fold hydrolase [Actinomycetota bacterium]|nr:alpha/beta fold hydrolase [Actinomycetota bacterium]
MTVAEPSTAPPDIPGLEPTWSRWVTVSDSAGVKRTWHVLDNGVSDPTGTILCVHGNPTWSYLWRQMLTDAPPGWRVVAPDHLGMGYSDRLQEPRTLLQRVEDLGDLTDVLGLTGPVVTLAHDWGGAISLGWALKHPQQLRGIVLTNTAIAQPEGDLGPALIRLAHAPLFREVVCVHTPAFVRAATALSRPALSRETRRGFAAPYSCAVRRQSIGDFVADIPFTQDHPSRPTLESIAGGVSSIDVPVLLLWGPRDPVFGEKYLADLRERLPQAQLHRYEGASHLVTEDAPEYAGAVAQWVSDLGGQEAEGDGAELRPDSGWIKRSSSPATSPGQPTLWSALDQRIDDPSPAVVEVGGVSVSWSLLARRVREIAAGLVAAGVRPGDRVALLVGPSADLTAAVYAVWRAGGVIVVADKGLGFAGMRRALRSAGVDHVIGEAFGLAAARLMRLPGSRIAAGPVDRTTMRALGATRSLADLARLGRRAPAPEAPPSDQDCAVVFTSGATGPAKGVVYRHRQVLAQLEMLRSTYSLTAGDRLVAAFAPFALLGPGLGIGSAVPSIDVTAPETLTASDLADAAAAVDATVVFASPAALRTVAAGDRQLSPQQRSALGRIRLLMSAGAPVPASLLQSLGAVLPNAEVHTPYGMTEALPVTDVTLAEIDAAGDGDGVCVGRALSGVELAVSPLSSSGLADGALTRSADRTGEICVRAGHVKDRYDALWATERASSRETGWHRTGDVGHLDTEGRLWVEGRLPHVITTARRVVTPVGIEQRVERIEEIDAAAVVGVGPGGAQVVVVVVVLSPEEVSRMHRLASRLLALPRADLAVAETTLTDAVRQAAAVDVAAVLVAPGLPLDIRHASKIDRHEVSRWATRALAGFPVHGRSRPVSTT